MGFRSLCSPSTEPRGTNGLGLQTEGTHTGKRPRGWVSADVVTVGTVRVLEPCVPLGPARTQANEAEEPQGSGAVG